jgi:hypothetical protein
MRGLSRIGVSSFCRYMEIMSPTNPLLKDGPMPQPTPHEPSMGERRIIAGDQALLASESELRGEAARPDPNGEAFEPGSRAGAGRTFVSTATDGSVGAAFNALLASRVVQHSDVVIGLPREMLRPILKTWLGDNLPGVVERLVSAKSSGSRAAETAARSRLLWGRGPARGALWSRSARVCRKMHAIVAAGLTGIAPRDELEAMIAAQMLACHDTAMGFFRDALAANRTSRLFRDYLNQAGKLSRTFAMLLDALNHHRAKSSQKITVEQVHVICRAGRGRHS